MDPTMWNSYQIVSNRARAICYSVRQQHFRMKTEYTVNKLVHNTHEQIQAMQRIQVIISIIMVLFRFFWHQETFKVYSSINFSLNSLSIWSHWWHPSSDIYLSWGCHQYHIYCLFVKIILMWIYIYIFFFIVVWYMWYE